MKRIITSCLIVLCGLGAPENSEAQRLTRRVLFLGNSYTYVNNLPQLVADAAASAGDSLVFDSHTIGGYTLQQHAADATARAKIQRGDWDFVVLQEQSQRPAFPLPQVMTQVFPYAHQLDSLIRRANPCGQPVFYMTWGYRNGDAGNCPIWPPICTYAGMDSLLNLRYQMLADSNRALVSPVGAVWRYLRQQHPGINLYDTDDRHPSPAGSYAAACSFYSILFRRSPLRITFDGNLPAGDAAAIRAAAQTVVFDSLRQWRVGKYDPQAAFQYQLLSGNRVAFQHTATNATAFRWDFGDGQHTTGAAPTHTYATPGQYRVTLTASWCTQSDSLTQTINVIPNGLSESQSATFLTIVPNPVGEQLQVQISLLLTTYRIRNLVGAEVARGTITADGISVEALPIGLYWLEAQTAQGVWLRRRFAKSAGF